MHCLTAAALWHDNEFWKLWYCLQCFSPTTLRVGTCMLLFDNFENFEKATMAWQKAADQKISLKYFSSPVPLPKGKVKENTSWKQIPAPASGGLARILYCSFPPFVWTIRCIAWFMGNSKCLFSNGSFYMNIFKHGKCLVNVYLQFYSSKYVRISST